MATAACGDSPPVDGAEQAYAEEGIGAPASAHVVEITALDYGFGGPMEFPSGWVTFRMPNEGEENHVMVLHRIPDDADALDLLEASHAFGRLMVEGDTAGAMRVIKPFQSTFDQLTYEGGPGLTAPGRTAQITLHLEPGSYLMNCGVDTPEGHAHWQEGMQRRLTVTEESSGAPEPEADITLTLRNHGFEQEGTITARRRTVRVHFEEQPEMTHDVYLVRLEEGMTPDDVAEWTENGQEPSPFEFLGGAEQMLEGHTAYFTADFEPGRYAWICDEHAGKGMVEEFTVE